MRKRRHPTPGFKILPPYQPITGERAGLMVPGVHPHCAMMQVAAADTHDDYVVCRGYDTRVKRFFDYDATDADKPGIAVGKPFGNRSSGAYEIGQIFPALIPLTRIGQTPGVAADSTGHPADLDELVDILYDDNDRPINWMLLDLGETVGLRPFRLIGFALIPAGGVAASVAGGDARELDRTTTAEWLDDPGTAVTLYPSHSNALGNTDNFFALGIGRVPGTFFRGTYGWAKWVPKATAYLDGGETKYSGEWHIVRLEAETIARVKIPTGDGIEPDAHGLGNLWWANTAQAADALVDSNYQLEIFNDLNAKLEPDEELDVWFDADMYAWRPLEEDGEHFGEVQTGFANVSGAATRTVSIMACDREGNNDVGNAFDAKTELNPAKDTNLIEGNVVRYRPLGDGTRLIVSDIWDLPIGRIVWESLDKTNLRQGWRLCDGTKGNAHDGLAPDLQAKFIMSIDEGVAANADEDGIGDTGGTRQFTVSTMDTCNDNPVIGCQRVHQIDEEGDDVPGLGADEVDNRPPYYVLAALQRCDQRA